MFQYKSPPVLCYHMIRIMVMVVWKLHIFRYALAYIADEAGNPLSTMKSLKNKIMKIHICIFLHIFTFFFLQIFR